MITQEKLKKLLYYNKDTGFFVWKKDIFNLNKYKVANQGDIAGCISSGGYIQISIGGKCYSAHRLAWLYEFGHFPKLQIDHINRVRDDNRIDNLRDVSGKVNMSNKSKPGENKVEERIDEYRIGRFIDKILNKLERERIDREESICRNNEQIYKQQLEFYKYW